MQTLIIITALAAVGAIGYQLYKFYRKGLTNAGSNKRVVFSLPHWSSDPIVIYAADKAGLRRVAEEYPSCRYQVFVNNKPLFERFKHVKHLERDIMKGVI